jgi:hypothetical protein
LQREGKWEDNLGPIDRGADAIHLASALLVRDALQQPVTFACADIKLVAAARAEGLDVVP